MRGRSRKYKLPFRILATFTADIKRPDPIHGRYPLPVFELGSPQLGTVSYLRQAPRYWVRLKEVAEKLGVDSRVMLFVAMRNNWPQVFAVPRGTEHEMIIADQIELQTFCKWHEATIRPIDHLPWDEAYIDADWGKFLIECPEFNGFRSA